MSTRAIELLTTVFVLAMPFVPSLCSAEGPAVQAADFSTIDKRRPTFGGWNSRSRAFEYLPALKTYDYAVLERDEPIIRNVPVVTYDCIIRDNFAHRNVGWLAEDAMGILGALSGGGGPSTPAAQETRSALPDGQMRTRSGHTLHERQCPGEFARYWNAKRLVCLDDSTYCLLVFEPFALKNGKPLNSDPGHPSNWRALSKSDAIDVIFSEMKRQAHYKARSDVDPTYAQLFENLSGYRWQPYFGLLKVRFTELLKKEKGDALPNPLTLPNGETARTYGEFLRGPQPKKEKTKSPEPSVRSTTNTAEVGVEAGPVVAKILAPVLFGQVRGRRSLDSAIDMEDLLPNSGPVGTSAVGPLPVEQTMTMGNATEALAREFRENPSKSSTAKAVVLVMKTTGTAYEHDYPICPRYHLNALDDVASIAVSLGDSSGRDSETAWFWFSRLFDDRSKTFEVGCHFAVFVDEARRKLIVDSRWVDKQYCSYWRTSDGKKYDTILNYQVWSYNAEETERLVRSALRKLKGLTGNWSITYANQKEPTQSSVFVEETWLTGNTVHLSVWNRSWSPLLVCFHGTKQSQFQGQDRVFEHWKPVRPGRNVLQLPLGQIHNAVIHCEVNGFIDKVFVSRDRMQPAPKPAPYSTLSRAGASGDAGPTIKILWPPTNAKVVTLQDQLDMLDIDDGKRLAINGICPGAPDGSTVVVQIYTDDWYKHKGRRPEVDAGLWGVRAYLCGGEGSKHWIHATLFGPHGNKLATDQVGPIYRMQPFPRGAARQASAGTDTEGRPRGRQQKPQRIVIEAKDFRIQGSTRMGDGSVVVAGGSNGPSGQSI